MVSPEAIQAALLEFGGRVECTHPEEAMERAISAFLEVEGIEPFGENDLPFDPERHRQLQWRSTWRDV